MAKNSTDYYRENKKNRRVVISKLPMGSVYSLIILMRNTHKNAIDRGNAIVVTEGLRKKRI